MKTIQLEINFENGDIVYPLIRSVNFDLLSVLKNIRELSNIKEISLDFTYSQGNLYKKGGLPEPIHKMNVFLQQRDLVKLGELSPIPLPDNSCKCIVYNPPVIISPPDCPSMTTEKKGSVVMQKHYSAIRSFKALTEAHYFYMREIHRLLCDGGTVIIKCTPCVSSGRFINTNGYIWLLAESIGFSLKDIHLLIARSRIISGKIKKQQHSRRYETYFYVYVKNSKDKPKYLAFTDKSRAIEILSGFLEHNR